MSKYSRHRQTGPASFTSKIPATGRSPLAAHPSARWLAACVDEAGLADLGEPLPGEPALEAAWYIPGELVCSIIRERLIQPIGILDCPGSCAVSEIVRTRCLGDGTQMRRGTP